MLGSLSFVNRRRASNRSTVRSGLWTRSFRNASRYGFGSQTHLSTLGLLPC